MKGLAGARAGPEEEEEGKPLLRPNARLPWPPAGGREEQGEEEEEERERAPHVLRIPPGRSAGFADAVRGARALGATPGPPGETSVRRWVRRAWKDLCQTWGGS
ncbi:hypothetical protein LSM04_008955 [Trypanosoma melophagium]|uniref:uncharacterized protein n=1 Tax=Trypanosoma melophagium TaxID=715481 RepID=UPI003519F992|nr:hypothetical protein LSM04_008955 [Trypanosoma melophagium]